MKVAFEHVVVVQGTLAALRATQEDLFTEHTKLCGKENVLAEELALVKARKQRVAERIDALSQAIIQIAEGEE